MTTNGKKEPIAITGIGCRFPGNITNTKAFWEFLKKGGDAIVDIPQERWDVQSFYDPNPNKAGKIKAKKEVFLTTSTGSMHTSLIYFLMKHSA